MYYGPTKPIDGRLSEEDAKWATEEGLRRMGAAESRKHNIKLTQEEMDIIGVMAELAVARHFNVPMGPLYKDRTQTDVDLHIDGYKVGVKGTPVFKKPHLLVQNWKGEEDIVISVSVDYKTGVYRIWGYATAAEVEAERPRYWNKELPNKVRAISVYSLHPLKQREKVS